jgi:hypothetical protein
MTKLLSLPDLPRSLRWSDKREPKVWGVAIGSWGDVILDLAEFKKKVGRGGIILFTEDLYLLSFVRQQSFVEDVIFVAPLGHEDYIYQYMTACGSWDATDPDPIEEIVRRSGVDRVKVVQTQLTPERRGLTPWHGARLPRSSWKWAYEQQKWIPHDYYVIHPYSLSNSCPLEEHWPYWEGAIDYLIQSTPENTYVLTGTEWTPDFKHHNVIDLVDASESMMDVFALSEMSRGVITTSNALAHYCVVQNLPAVVCGNQRLSFERSPFREFLQADNINLLYYEDGLAKFAALVDKIA